MKLGDGVEQALHCVLMLSGLPAGQVLAAPALAEFHGVSPSYLLKHLQALSNAGILQSVPGPRGGYRLARPAGRITLLDVVLAVEGPEPAFRCAEIRQNGPSPLAPRFFKKPCVINAAMLRAERAYREELRKVTLDMLASPPDSELGAAISARACGFFAQRARNAPPSPSH